MGSYKLAELERVFCEVKWVTYDPFFPKKRGGLLEGCAGVRAGQHISGGSVVILASRPKLFLNSSRNSLQRVIDNVIMELCLLVGYSEQGSVSPKEE